MLAFNSCRHDSCIDLNCRNGGSCVDDVCQCPTGYEGAECTIQSKSRFIGMWVGTSKCGKYQPEKDTVEFMTWCNPDRLVIKTGIGNLSNNTFIGRAGTPEMVFEEYEDDNVIISPYVKVDANFMQLSFVSVYKSDPTLRYICDFEGRRVAGTDTMEGFNGEKGDCGN